MNSLKTKLSGLMIATMVLFGAQVANADVEGPVWDCTLKFNIEGGGVKVFVGEFQMTGEGELSCYDTKGNTEIIPVLVMLGSQTPSLNISVGKLNLLGVAKGIGVATDPLDLLVGDYLVLGATGALGVGGGVNLSAKHSANSMTLNMSLQLAGGFGFSVGFDYLSIYLDGRPDEYRKGI